MKLIVENTPDVIKEQVIEEGTEDKSWYISGITLQSNVKNGNGRVYPKEVLQKAIAEHKEKYLTTNRSAGELGHPDKNQADVNSDNVCMKFVSVEESGNDFITKAKVCSSLPKGKILEGLLKEGFNLGISSRGLGNIKESNGAKIVSDYTIVTLGDIVWNPSAPDAFVSGVMEQKEWVWENGVLVEKEIEQKIDEWKETIEKADKAQLQEAINTVFKDFIKTLKF